MYFVVAYLSFHVYSKHFSIFSFCKIKLTACLSVFECEFVLYRTASLLMQLQALTEKFLRENDKMSHGKRRCSNMPTENARLEIAGHDMSS